MEFKSPVDGLKIDFSVYEAENEKVRMLFLTGRAEYYRKYEFLFTMLNDEGITVYAMDHRGQGHSGRMLKDPQVGHVEKFSHFVDDAEFFLTNYVLKDKDGHVPVLSLSHSMGGAVSILLGLRKNYFNKMVFTSPMWGINTGLIGNSLACLISRISCSIGKADDFVIGTGPDDLNSDFEKNRLTHSKEKFNAQKDYLKAHPEAVLGGPSNRWLHESLKMCKDLKRLDYSSMKSEVLLLQAGDEKVVDNQAQNKISEKIKTARKIVVEGAFHELLNESEEIFEKVFSQMISFVKK